MQVVTEQLQEGTYQTYTTSDGYPCSYRQYLPACEPRAEVICLHGIQSHAGWYEYSCGRLAQEGYRVSFLERRGSGRNQQARGDAPHFRRLLDDLADFLKPLRAAVPARPIVLLAISWGAKLAVSLPGRHPGLFDALALLCPGFFPVVRPSPWQRLRIAWGRLTCPDRLFPIPLDDPELFTANPRWLDFLRRDPLALHQATARLLIESVRLDLHLRRAADQVRVPVALLLAGRDRIIDNRRTRNFVTSFPAPVQVLEYPEARHTLEFEPNPDLFVTDLLTWLRSLPNRLNP